MTDIFQWNTKVDHLWNFES